VAYRDGDQVFAFGHALDALGRRALFMQDSYVFGVIGNPVGIPELGAVTYKLASSRGHPLGQFTNDVFGGIGGRLGPGPPAIPLRVTARDRGDGSSVTLDSQLADERELGLGAGISFIAPLAATTALDRLLHAFQPVRLRACVRFRVDRLRRPIGFCNAYFDSFEAMFDIGRASDLVDRFDFAPLLIRSASVSLAARRGVVDEVLVAARATRSARRGTRVPVRVRVQRRGGGRRTITARVPVPRHMRPGRRTVVLAGNGFSGDPGFIIELLAAELGGAGRATAAQSEPPTVRRLARRLRAIERPLGIEARFGRRNRRVVYRSNDVRFDGRVKVRLRVSRARP
jgi:hypothetical protein